MILGWVGRDRRVVDRSLEVTGEARSNNSNAADGQKSLVLSSRLSAAADLSR